ncbi:MAG: CoA protein activase [Clostridia bacterium]|nr:CoA protein activase [Clostridia bacterium]
MRITFPHMGNLAVALESIFSSLGAQVVAPPLNKETIALGSRYAPEGACFPFKLVLGNYLQALEEGTDTLIMLGGNGPCRFGYFGNLAGVILQDLGYEFRMVILEGDNFLSQIASLGEELGAGWRDILRVVRLGWYKLAALDQWEALVNQKRAVAGSRVDALYLKGVTLLGQALNINDINEGLNYIQNEINNCLDSSTLKQTPRIAIVGDIYMQVEPFANHNLARLLGERGFAVYRSIYVSSWVKHNFWPPAKKREAQRLLKDAKPYLCSMVGGHGLDTVANTVNYQRQGFHGVIQILPMTCMPEIVAQSLLPKVSRDLDIPILSLVLDEHSAQEGLITRIEAFTDVVRHRYNMSRSEIVGSYDFGK